MSLSFQGELCKAIIYKQAIANRESKGESMPEEVSIESLEKQTEDARLKLMESMLVNSFTGELQSRLGIDMDSLKLKIGRYADRVSITLTPALSQLFFESRVHVSALFNMLDRNRFSELRTPPSWVLGRDSSQILRESNCWVLSDEQKRPSESEKEVTNVIECVDHTIGLMRKLIASEHLMI